MTKAHSGVALSLALGLGVVGYGVRAEARSIPPVIEEPERTVGPETCGRCHGLELEVWKSTDHAALYDSDEPLHTRARAREIAALLGVRLIQHDSLCLDCHFTPQQRGERITARAGVSCESCHGAARDWVNVHNTFRGRDVERARETAEQSRERIARNARAGMTFSGTLYDLVSRCYRCHTVPAERLVSVGEHTRGGEIDLFERLDAIRHNFVRGARKENAPFPPERKRQLLVLAPAAELEMQLRAIAVAAAADTPYAQSKARRVEKLLRELSRLSRRMPLPEVDAMLAAAEGLELTPGNATALEVVAERVAAAGRAFVAEHDGSDLALLDAAVSEAIDDAQATTALGPLEAAGEETLAAAAGGEVADPPPAAGEESRASAGGAAERPRPATRRQPAGSLAAQLRAPLSDRAVVGQGRCDACHTEANAWWYDDPHQRAADPFFERAPEVRRIAITYYGRPVDEHLATGRAVCMDCHGTVLSGREGVEVESGPSCESCHGPAGDYLKPHPEAPRTTRQSLGMVDVAEPKRRAEVCASCHYITDLRLLASGHSAGSGFDLAQRSDDIRHGTRPAASASGLRTAWQGVLARLGPQPEVEVVAAELPVGRDRAGSASADPRAAAARRALSSAPLPPAARPFVPASSPLGRAVPEALAAGIELALEPLPEDAARRSLDELLRLVQERLIALHALTVGPEP